MAQTTSHPFSRQHKSCTLSPHAAMLGVSSMKPRHQASETMYYPPQGSLHDSLTRPSACSSGVKSVLAYCRLPAAGLAKEGSALIRALSGLPKLGRWGKNRELAVLQPVLETTQVMLKTAQHTADTARHTKIPGYTSTLSSCMHDINAGARPVVPVQQLLAHAS